MRKLVSGTLLAAALGIASYAAISATASDRPPDVEARDWIALGPDWGFVVDSVSSGLRPPDPSAPVQINRTALYAPADARLVPRTLNGFFVVKRDGAWARIAAMPTP